LFLGKSSEISWEIVMLIVFSFGPTLNRAVEGVQVRISIKTPLEGL
jgi:hypothetical protein